MTDRIKGLTVTLEDNVREDDAQAIIDAIRMLRRVVSVDVHVADIDHHMAVQQAKHEFRGKIIELYDTWK